MLAWQGSNAEILFGEEAPERLREHRQAMLSLVDAIRRDVPHQLRRHADAPFRNHLYADGSSTIAILGDRGSGKTTLLFSVCAELLRAGTDIVLPPMRPELFSPNESVISAFLASLWTLHTERAASLDSPHDATGIEARGQANADRELIGLIQDCARSYAASRTTEAALAHATESTIDYAEDAIAISRSGARLPWQIGALAQRICLDEQGAARLIVVPIDDPDLAPAAVRAILRDLRVLGSIPGVVPVASFCPADLAAAWLSDYTGTETSTRLKSAERYEREMEKLFPYRARFEIEPLSVHDRINFTPIGEVSTLEHGLEALRHWASKEGHDWPIDAVLVADQSAIGLPNALPQNPRTLVQMWSSLEPLVSYGEDVKPHLVDQTLRSVCALLTEPVRLTLDLAAGEAFYELGLPLADDPHSRTPIRIETPRIQLQVGAAAGYRRAVQGVGFGSLRLRPILRIDTRRVATNANEPMEPLPSRITSALLAFREVLYGSGRFLPEGRPYRLDVSDWMLLQEIEIAGLATDNRFVLLPEATTLGEVLQSVAGWNSLVRLADGDPESVSVLASVVELSCEMVSGYPEVAAAGELPYEEAFAKAVDIYRTRRADDGRASERFRTWFEDDLPLQWHSAFFGEEQLRKYISAYRDVTQPAFERSERDARLSPRATIDYRFGRILDAIVNEEDRLKHCWLAGYFELASAIESTHLAGLAALSKPWRERTTALRAGSRAAEQMITHSAGARELAPYATPEGEELFIRARDLLRRKIATVHRELSQPD